MTILERTVPLAEARRADLWAPRTDVVIERSVAPGVFEAATGPFARYERRVEEDPTSATATETIDYRLAPLVWRLPFAPLYRRALSRPPRPGHQPWWAP
ncbi:MAG TPA: hypothetical protein VIR58_17875, partial [Acidimicrobiales bacterium]